jgi:hypothetical protein
MKIIPAYLCMIVVSTGIVSCAKRYSYDVISVVNFEIRDSREVNEKFAKSLHNVISRKQIRGGPVGSGIRNVGDVEYEIAIIGSCDGFIEDTIDLIEYSAELGGLSSQKILAEYKSTARCRRYHMD